MAMYANPSVLTWEDFKRGYGRRYSPHEDRQRLAIFNQRSQLVDAHNQNRQMTYKLATNKFSDWTSEELGSLKTARNPLRVSPGWENQFYSESVSSLPTEIDWRRYRMVTSVKNQGRCGSCWAFSATGAIEGQLAKNRRSLISLSEQQLVDCTGLGCNGGTVEQAFDYVRRNGICQESVYPYVGKAGPCRGGIPVVTRIRSYRPINNERALQQAVAKDGPVAVGIHTTDKFQHYSRGIFLDDSCSPRSRDLNHAVLVVGYGTERGLDYWIVKNSWGSDWGEDGYIRMARNRSNQCGIGTEGCIPVL